MIRLQESGLDLQALPADLLPGAKAQMHVDHSDNDVYIKSVLARAIAYWEGVWNIAINPRTVVWTPANADFLNGETAAPVRPIAAMTAAATAGDVTSQYVLAKQGLFGAPLYLISGAWQDGLAFSFQCGFATAATLPPGIEDNVMTLATHLYEHREIFLNQGTDAVPMPAIDSATPWWVPRV
jgi:hypothetical protein